MYHLLVKFTNSHVNKDLASVFVARAVAYFQIGSFKSCALDIECALKFGYGDISYLTELLKQCSVQCLSSSSEATESILELSKKLKLPGNVIKMLEREQWVQKYHYGKKSEDVELLPENREWWVSPSIGIVYSSRQGRHTVANQPITADSVLLIEKPYVSFPCQYKQLSICQNCCKEIAEARVLPCRGCSEVAYCSFDCELLAWLRFHRHECGEHLLKIISNHTYTAVRSILRIGIEKAIKLSQFPQLAITKEDKLFLDYHGLLHHEDKFSHTYMASAVFHTVVALFYLDSRGCLRNIQNDKNSVMKLGELLLSFSLRACVNNFGMFKFKESTDQWTLPSTGFGKAIPFKKDYLGTALVYKGSLFNHSCDPNTFWGFNNGYFVVKASKFIRQGEELSITYGPSCWMSSYPERQKTLKMRYFFDCQCSACKKDYDYFVQEMSRKRSRQRPLSNRQLCSNYNIEQ